MEEINDRSFSGYLSWTILLVLLIFGPGGHYKFALIVRIIYLIAIPLFIHSTSNWMLNRLDVSNKTVTILNRILFSLIGILFIIWAVDTSQQTKHWENTKVVYTGGEYEDVGEDVLVNGTNWGVVFMLALLGIIFLWYGFIKYIRINSDL